MTKITQLLLTGGVLAAGLAVGAALSHSGGSDHIRTVMTPAAASTPTTLDPAGGSGVEAGPAAQTTGAAVPTATALPHPDPAGGSGTLSGSAGANSAVTPAVGPSTLHLPTPNPAGGVGVVSPTNPG